MTPKEHKQLLRAMSTAKVRHELDQDYLPWYGAVPLALLMSLFGAFLYSLGYMMFATAFTSYTMMDKDAPQHMLASAATVWGVGSVGLFTWMFLAPAIFTIWSRYPKVTLTDDQTRATERLRTLSPAERERALPAYVEFLDVVQEENERLYSNRRARWNDTLKLINKKRELDWELDGADIASPAHKELELLAHETRELEIQVRELKA